MSYEKSAILNQESPTNSSTYYIIILWHISSLNLIAIHFLMNTKRVYSLLPKLARNASIEYGASLGMVIILTSIFERVLVYFWKIEFFLTSNLE